MRRSNVKTLVGVAWFAAFAAVIAAGCSDTGPDGPTYQHPDKSSYCDARARAECNSEVITACSASDADGCIAQLNADCIAKVPANSTYQPANADACIAAVSQAFADAKLKPVEIAAYDEACLIVFDGRANIGEACTGDSDCQVSTGARCIAPAGASGGTCQIPERKTGGEKCDAPAAQCMPGFHCGASQHCDADGAAGDACGPTAPCGTGLSCGTTSQRCEAKRSDGAACTGDADCMNGLCDQGANGAAGVCTSQITFSTMEAFCVSIR